jgi:hypothetical protein
MLPAAWAAIKGLSLAKRIGVYLGMFALVASLLGGLWLHGKHTGLDEKQQEWDASISRQASETIRNMAELHESRDIVLRKTAEREQVLQRKIDELERRKVNHVSQPTKPCEAPPGSVAMFNAISGLHATDSERVPSADGTPGESYESSEARIEVTRLLLAYVYAYGDASEQLATLWVKYDGLVQERRGQWIVENARHANAE